MTNSNSNVDMSPEAISQLDNNQLREIISQGWRNFAKANLAGRDLSCLDLSGASFRGASLAHADMSKATLSFADLRDVCLDDATLAQTYFLDAQMAGASFRGAMMEAAFLMSADLSGCDFRRANLNYASLMGANLSNAVLSETELVCANLSGAVLKETTFDASFGDTSLCGLDLTEARSLSTACHTGTSNVDLGTLRRTATSMCSHGPERYALVAQFLADAGLTPADRRYFAELLAKAVPAAASPVFREPSAVDEVYVVRDPLREYSVQWDAITQEEIDAFEELLETATKEAALQKFLEQHPAWLAQHFKSSHGRWVIPQKRLGSEYVADFVVGTKDSLGYHWYLVELEGPREQIFVRAGDPAQQLRHAVRQIQDWRNWLSENLGYARRALEDDGLGLTDIDAESRGVVLIGRRASIDPSTRHRRRRMAQENNMDIHTYDFLLDAARDRLRRR